MRLDYDRSALPCLIEWQCLQSGLYVLGIEPSTNHLLGRGFAEERGELIELGHGEVRRYRSRLSCSTAARRSPRRATRSWRCTPPPDDFAPATEVWPVLREPS